MIDFDGSWKDVLDFFLEPFFRFFHPEPHADIDWTVDPVSLKQEFHALFPESATGDMRCDTLLRLALRDDQGTALAHIEIQCQYENEFPSRVYDYNQAAVRHYRETVSSLVLLGDENRSWRPREFGRERWQTGSSVFFEPRKLLDWEGHDDELEQHENCIGLVVLAHLKALQTRGNLDDRRAWRLRLVRLALDRAELDAEDRVRLAAIIEGLLDLPPDVDTEVRQTIRREREVPKMPRVSSLEIIAREVGREGGLRDGILTVVRLRFGEPDTAFVAALNQAQLEALETVLTRSRTAQGLDELRALLTPSNGHTP